MFFINTMVFLVFNILNMFFTDFLNCYALFPLVYTGLLYPPPEINSESNFFEDASLKSTIEEKEEIEV